MKIYKFGGASVKDASGVKNIFNIISTEKHKLIIVVSAMGKMTNEFEKLCSAYYIEDKDAMQISLTNIKNFHNEIVAELFGTYNENIQTILKNIYCKLEYILANKPSLSYDFEYDRIICFGELLSTSIITTYLQTNERPTEFVDIRTCLITDNHYRNANVDMELSRSLSSKVFNFKNTTLYVTQGFIAGTRTNQTTTLGREGSDYTAALLANFLHADSVTVWKDVPGFMTADPKYYDNSTLITELTYKEVLELTSYGAKIIHPKTMRPIKIKNIPLYVRSFLHPNEIGTTIAQTRDENTTLPPIFIDKNEQILLTLSPLDFSFIAEEKLGQICSLFAEYDLKVNVIQISALTFSFVMDKNDRRFEELVAKLQELYKVKYNKDLHLLTIRYYNATIIDKLLSGKEVLLQQRTRTTARFVIHN